MSTPTQTPAAQPEAIARVSSMDAARAALMRRMRRAGHTPGQSWAGEVDGSSRGAGYVCVRCLGCWNVIEHDGGPSWSIGAIRPCTSPPS